MKRYGDLAARLAEKSHRVPSGCLIWEGRITRGGYGILMVEGKRHVAHRVAWHVATGDPLDMPEIVRHYRCRTPAYIEASHLRKGTHADNNADMVRDGTSTRGEKATRGKLNRDQVRELRGLREEGWTQDALAERYGIRQSSVWAILEGRSWGWLDNPA